MERPIVNRPGRPNRPLPYQVTIVPAVIKASRPWQSRLTGSPVLIISILIHILLGAITFFFIVERIKEKRVANFAEVKMAPGAAAQLLDHKIELTKKKKAMSVPDVIQRITTTGLSTIVLPEVNMPSDTYASESTSKMDSTQISSSLNNQGNGDGIGIGQAQSVSIDASAIATSAFGLSDGKGLGLVGYFYDLKQTRNRTPTDMTIYKYPGLIADYLNKGWPDDYFNNFFVGPKPLYLPQMFTPYMLASDGPKAFGLQDLVKPTQWVILYKGKVRVPHAGIFRFVGFGDDVCEIAVDHKLVLEASYRRPPSELKLSIPDAVNRPSAEEYKYTFPIELPGAPSSVMRRFQCGDWMHFEENQVFYIQILVGEHPGGKCGFWIMVQEKDHNYDKISEGCPILPLFKVSNVKMPPTNMGCPPYDDKTNLGWTVVDDDSDSTDATATPIQTN